MSRHVEDYIKWSIVIRCYAELLRLRYDNPSELTEARAQIAKQIQELLEQVWEDYIVAGFLRGCENRKTDDISNILKAIGPIAFDEPWFIDGMKALHSCGKRFVVPSISSKFDISDLLNESRKLEKKLKRYPQVEALSFFDEPNLTKTRYYREFPRKQKIMLIHFIYGLLNEEFHKQVLNEITPYGSPAELNKYLDAVKNVKRIP